MENIETFAEIMKGMKIVDLSHTLEEQIPAVPTHTRFGHVLWNSYWHGDRALTYQLSMSEHTGTHVDAPCHFIKEGRSHIYIDEVSIDRFCGPFVRIDLSSLDPQSEVTAKHIQQWEEKNGSIKAGDVVLIYYGWSRFWKKRPNDTQFLSDWPGIGRSAAEHFVEKGVKLVGVDTINVEVFGSAEYPAHYTLLEEQIIIAENLNNLDRLPDRGYFMAFPLRIKEGSGSPVRAVAFIE